MCAKGNCCEKPEEIKGKPQYCSPEQIKKCHGSEADHPCAEEEKTAE